MDAKKLLFGGSEHYLSMSDENWAFDAGDVFCEINFPPLTEEEINKIKEFNQSYPEPDHHEGPGMECPNCKYYCGVTLQTVYKETWIKHYKCPHCQFYFNQSYPEPDHHEAHHKSAPEV